MDGFGKLIFPWCKLEHYLENCNQQDKDSALQVCFNVSPKCKQCSVTETEADSGPLKSGGYISCVQTTFIQRLL